MDDDVGAHLDPRRQVGRLRPQQARAAEVVSGEARPAPRRRGRRNARLRPTAAGGCDARHARRPRRRRCRRAGRGWSRRRPPRSTPARERRRRSRRARRHWRVPRCVEQLLRFLLRRRDRPWRDRGEVLDQRRRRHRARQPADRAHDVDAQLVGDVVALDVLAERVGDDVVVDGALQLGDAAGPGRAWRAAPAARATPASPARERARTSAAPPSARGAPPARRRRPRARRGRRRPAARAAAAIARGSLTRAERLDGASPHVGRAMPGVERQRVDRRLVGAQRVRLAQLAERVERRLQARRRAARGQHLESGSTARGRSRRARASPPPRSPPSSSAPISARRNASSRSAGKVGAAASASAAPLALALARGARRLRSARRGRPRGTAR